MLCYLSGQTDLADSIFIECANSPSIQELGRVSYFSTINTSLLDDRLPFNSNIPKQNYFCSKVKRKNII